MFFFISFSLKSYSAYYNMLNQPVQLIYEGGKLPNLLKKIKRYRPKQLRIIRLWNSTRVSNLKLEAGKKETYSVVVQLVLEDKALVAARVLVLVFLIIGQTHKPHNYFDWDRNM